MAFIVEQDYASPEIITLATMRKQLELEEDFTEDDALISSYIAAAINQAENYINSEILEKKFTITSVSFDGVLNFKRQKLQSIESIAYKDAAGVSQTITANNYSIQTVDSFENTIVFNEDFVFPILKKYDQSAVTLKIVVGYPIGKVPKVILQAIILTVSHFYENRVDYVKEKGTAAEVLLQQYRRY
jgi:uncharacterized phiE125 gp8 family phage protein